VLTGFAVTVVGGIAGFAAARGSNIANGTPVSGTAPGYPPPKKKTAGALLVALSKVPKGGGIVLSSKKIVVTRDSTGNVHGFSAVCTHLGCLVNQVANGTIDCPCHGSRFNATTGAVVAGPAPSPLPNIAIDVHNGGVYQL